jgi:hypothetical protein
MSEGRPDSAAGSHTLRQQAEPVRSFAADRSLRLAGDGSLVMVAFSTLLG